MRMGVTHGPIARRKRQRELHNRVHDLDHQHGVKSTSSTELQSPRGLLLSLKRNALAQRQ